jgi:Flp pilus assembly CpaE family ATPase
MSDLMNRQEEPPAWLAEYEDFVAPPAKHPAEPATNHVSVPAEPTSWVVNEVQLGRQESSQAEELHLSFNVQTPKAPQPEAWVTQIEPTGPAQAVAAHNFNAAPPNPRTAVNRGRVVAFRGVASGAGRTVLAANLAFEVAALGRSVCIVDLDHQFPTLHRYFGISSPKAAVLAAARFAQQQRLDASTLDQLKVRLVSKGVVVDLISGYGLPQNEPLVEWETIELLLEFLALRYQVVILDSTSGWKHQSHRVLDKVADLSVWVTQPDAISMGRFIDAQQEINADQRTGESVLVVNRVRASVLGARPDWQIQQLLKDRTAMQIGAMIPHDDALDQAMLQGLPLRQTASRSKALAAVTQLAKRLS